MRVKVRPMRLKGRNLPRAQCLAQPGTLGELSVCEWRDPELGRCVVRAQLRDSVATSTDVLPELDDAQLLSMKGGQMRIAGYERIEHASYAQTWLVEVA